MQIFFCIHKDDRRLETIHLAFLQNEIPGGTIMEGRGMGQALCHDLPIFAQYGALFPDSGLDSYCLFCAVSNQQADLCFEIVKSVSQTHDHGICFTIPVTRFHSIGVTSQVDFPQSVLCKEDKDSEKDKDS